MQSFKDRIIESTKRYDPWIYLVVVAATFIFGGLLATSITGYYLQKYDALYPLPPQSNEKREYRQDEAIPNKPITVSELSAENHSEGKKPASQEVKSDLASTAAIAEFIKNKRDINAQEGMWRAANFLVILTIAQVFIGGITAWYLVRTFRTQRSELGAANRAADVAESAEKPYVFFTVEAKHISPEKGPDSKIGVELILKNYGKSPAINVSYTVELTAIDQDSRDFCGKNLRPSGSGIVLEAGGKVDIIPALPKFFGNTYVNEASSIAHYMVTCSYEYSEIGKTASVGKSIHYEVMVYWPNSIPDDETIQVGEVDSETFARYQAENRKYIEQYL